MSNDNQVNQEPKYNLSKMKKIIHLSVLLFLSAILSVNLQAQAPIRVVCVGNIYIA